MSSDEAGFSMSGPLIALCVVAVFALALYCAFRYGKERTRLFQDFAHQKGLAYSRQDSGSLKAKADLLFPDLTFSPNETITVETGRRSLFLFDSSYNYRRRARNQMFGTACLISSDRFAGLTARTEIIPRSRLDEVMSANKVEISDPEFSEQFLVISDLPNEAKKVINEKIRRLLISHSKNKQPGFEMIAISREGAMVLTGALAFPERWPELIRIVSNIEEAME